MNAKLLIGTTLVAALSLAAWWVNPAQRDVLPSLSAGAAIAPLTHGDETPTISDFEMCDGELAFFLWTHPTPWTLPHWFFPGGEAYMMHPHMFDPYSPYYVQS